jgi:opacity protein-like surface antigen
LALVSYLFGPRYLWHAGRTVVPFAQILPGAAHASGSLARGSNGNIGSADAFAFAAGGGIDIILTSHLALRPAELQYFYTRFNNGSNNHQNNLRYNAGLIFRFGSR